LRGRRQTSPFLPSYPLVHAEVKPRESL
jgi:hypothetical protein